MKPEAQRIAIRERFWKKADVFFGDDDSCWNWGASVASNGYGQFTASDLPTRQAHRLAWLFTVGEIPDGLEVCHKCDNRRCVRPSHLFLGTKSDNMRDMVVKNRHNTKPGCLAMLGVRRIHRGVNNHECKLTEEQALIARACPNKRGAASALARAFNVSLPVICDIRTGKRWSHLPEPDSTAAQRAEAFLRTIGKWVEE